MSSMLLEATPVASSPRHIGSSAEDGVRLQVQSVLGNAASTGPPTERRSNQRYPYPRLITLTPVAEDGITPDGQHIVVVGKHLSECGLDFYHEQPLPHRRMIASIETADGDWVAFLLNLTWCRFTKQGWYDNGGRFVRVVDSPLAGN